MDNFLNIENLVITHHISHEFFMSEKSIILSCPSIKR